MFNDAYKSDLSLLILDDLERLIDLVPLGNRFSNAVLQTLLVRIKEPPSSPDRKIMIIGTTSQRDTLFDLGLISCFDVKETIPLLREPNDFVNVLSNFSCDSQTAADIGQDLHQNYSLDGVSMKKLILASGLAAEKSGTGNIEKDHLVESLDYIMS